MNYILDGDSGCILSKMKLEFESRSSLKYAGSGKRIHDAGDAEATLGTVLG